MTAHQLSFRRGVLISLFSFAAAVVMVVPQGARAQNNGDWQTLPGNSPGGLQGGGSAWWDNSLSNSLGNSNTWQMYVTGTGWVTESGNTAGTGYPNNNSGTITILSGTTISNASASGSSTVIDNVIVQPNASLQIYKYTFTLNHNGVVANDLDVFGTLGLTSSTAGAVYFNSGATIVMENGSTMTNNGATSGDTFTGPGYLAPGLVYVNNAITFASNSLFVLAAQTNKGTLPFATWQPGSTCMIAPPPSNTTNFIPTGLAGQTFYNLTWYWPTSRGKNGGSAEGGTFTVAHNFAMTANPNGSVTNEDIPYSGNTLTVGGTFGITNVSYYPTASAGTVTFNFGGDVSVDSTATLKLNSTGALGNVTFDGTNGPQTVGFYGSNSLGSPGNWNWTVASGSTVDLNSPMAINGGGANTGGALTINGALNLTANGAISGTSNVITVAQNGSLNIALGALSLGAEDILQGAGTVDGNATIGNSAVLHPGQGLPMVFNGGLAFGGATATNIFNLTSSPSGANDQVSVQNGILNPNGAQVVINSSGSLSTSDYVLAKVSGAGGSISSAYNSTPAWAGTPPANSNFYSVITSGNEVLLHYGTVAVPPPGITSATLSGSNVVLTGTNGAAGNYIVLTTTNLSAGTWTPVSTNAVAAGGSFSITATNVVIHGAIQQFFKLQAP